MCIACSPAAAAVFGDIARRGFLMRAGAIGALGVAGGPCSCFEASAAADGGDTFYVDGPIVTMADAAPTAEAVLARGGKIVAVGSRADVEKQSQVPVTTVDLRGRALLPGFVDAHGHVLMAGLQALSANLLPPPDGEGDGIAALRRLLSAWAANNRKIIERYKCILGFGYDDGQLNEQRHPTRADLDAVSQDTLVLVIHQSGHIGALDSRGLELVGIAKDAPNPAGCLYRREADGVTPNGICEEAAFFGAEAKVLSSLDPAAYLRMIEAGAKFYASFGYTTVQEGRAMPGSATMIAKAGEAGLPPVDVVVYPDIFESLAEIAPSPDYRNRVRIDGAKATIHGSPQGKTALLSEPYFKPPKGQNAGYRGYTSITKAQLADAFDRAYSNNWQILVHANGDAAIDWLIAAVDAARASHGGGDRRTVLIHGQVKRLDQLPKLEALEILPSFFPIHTYYWSDWHRESVLGPERAERISPCASARRLGMIFKSHHDAPVANPDSNRVLSATVTRVTRTGYVLGPDERVYTMTAMKAMKAMTIWPAMQYSEQAGKGSIEPGKLADFVILSANPLGVAPEDLIKLKVLETIKEGRSVYVAD